MKLKSFMLLGTGLIVLSACSGGEDKEESQASSDENEDNVYEVSSDSENEDNGEAKAEKESEESESTDSELINASSTESGWINFEGENGSSEDYLVTDVIEYDPSSNYELAPGGYIAYYNGDEFLQTKLQNEAGEIEQVEKADTIRISYHSSFSDRISLKEQ